MKMETVRLLCSATIGLVLPVIVAAGIRGNTERMGWAMAIALCALFVRTLKHNE